MQRLFQTERFPEALQDIHNLEAKERGQCAGRGYSEAVRCSPAGDGHGFAVSIKHMENCNSDSKTVTSLVKYNYIYVPKYAQSGVAHTPLSPGPEVQGPHWLSASLHGGWAGMLPCWGHCQPVPQSCLRQVVISTLLPLCSGFCLSRSLASKILHGE